MASKDAVNGIDGDKAVIDVEAWKDETGKTVVQHLSEGFAGDDEAVADGAILRYRAPFLRVIKHDAYFDAFNIVVESMLNRCVMISLILSEIFTDIGLMAVFDGHGGAECSAYSCAHLPAEFVRALNVHPSSLEDSLKEAFERLDTRLSARCENERWRSGTTAVAAAIDPKQIAIAWIGDSAAYILSEPEKFQKITRAHVPTNEEEARRVEQDGGQLLYIQGELRVNGVLNLTRALGDIGGRPMISPKADTTLIDRDTSQYLVLLACDGVSELFRDSEVLDMIKSFVAKHSYKHPHAGVKEEARRVEQDGGQLLYIQGELRVNGVLNLTRALGEFSGRGDIGGRPMISPKADTTLIDRDTSQYLVLLACDGVSELFRDSEVLDMIKSFVAKHSYKRYYDLSDHICRAALAGGSIDNVTCVAVFLRPPKDLWELFGENTDI
ncbi:protein phosphatase 2C [Ancylostoma caninum]|uniref:Protein phosphatase 2C n=1 Tax=Ancylostoma caninum TaxID=29170 RepID=A0A368G8H1_ANCCA|nr:protein phosphatase 2C [Ancylostoma caninum]